MAKTREIVSAVLTAVSEETEIPYKSILSRCSSADVVDARWLAVILLHKSGIYAVRIADHLNITPRYVQYIITDFGDRAAVNKALRNNYEKIANKLRKELETTALGGLNAWGNFASRSDIAPQCKFISKCQIPKYFLLASRMAAAWLRLSPLCARTVGWIPTW